MRKSDHLVGEPPRTQVTLKAATTARFDVRFPLHPSLGGGPVQVGWQVSSLLSRTHMHVGSTARRNGTRGGNRVGS